MSGWVAVWLLVNVNPPQDHPRTAATSMGLPNTIQTLTDWSKSCRGQKDGWGLEHVMDKERLRELGF